MIGSPDLLAFTDSAAFSEDDDPDLPEELPKSQPWFSAAQFRRDFILVAEFSEQVGPRPVLTIPDDPKLIGTFDLNHFSVRMMSVDYQASGPGHAPQIGSGPRLHFNEDSEVILGDSGRDAFAYVHHLTLHDLEARGMVRPFCMAYISSDQNKLMENFSELSAGLSRAAEILKTGNRQMFSVELQTKLQQLQFRRMSLLAAPQTDGDSSQLEALDRSISTHRELLRQVTSYPNRKLQQPDFLPYDPADPLADVVWVPPPEEAPPTAACTKQCLKSLPELCNSYFLSLTRSHLADMELRLRGDRTVLHAARITRWLSKQLPLTNFLFELWRPEECEDEEESLVAPVASSKRGDEPSSPDTFSSCVEELAIKLEPAAAPTSDLCSQMTGSVSSSDSIEVLATERSYRAQRVEADSRETPSGAPVLTLAPPPLRRLAGTDTGVRRAAASTRRANSEDSIEVLSTTESICPEDLTAITEEDPEKSFEESLQNSQEEIQVRAELVEEEAKDLDRTSEVDQSLSSDKLAQVLIQNSVPPQGTMEPNQWSLPHPPTRVLSVDEASDRTNSDPTNSGAGPVRRRRKAGLRALRFLKENSFSQHAVFCLLSGRALVVLGTDASRVRKLLDGLSLFLPAPGLDRAAVMSSLTAPLQLSDLLTRRLIGVHRSACDSSPLLASLTRLRRYLAVLDLDQGTLRCPAYSGSLLGRLANPHTSIGRGATYLLHLESGLTALSNWTLLYAFARCHGDGEHFLRDKGLCSSDADVSVMRFLSELLTLQHVGRGPPVLRFSYVPAQLHRNSHPT